MYQFYAVTYRFYAVTYRCAFSECMAYASSPNVWVENGDFWGRKLYSRQPGFQKYLEPNNRRWIELLQERANTEDPCLILLLWYVDVCVLFLRWNHLRVVLFNTRVQSCHNLVARMCKMCVCMWVVRIKRTSSLLFSHYTVCFHLVPQCHVSNSLHA